MITGAVGDNGGQVAVVVRSWGCFDWTKAPLTLSVGCAQPRGEAMAETILDSVKRASGWSIALGILMILAGMLAILFPLVGGVVAVYVVAWTAIFNGAALIVYGFRAHSAGRGVLEIVLGLLYIVPGGGHPLSPPGGAR